MFAFKDKESVLQRFKNPKNREKLEYSEEINDKGEVHIAGLHVTKFINEIPNIVDKDACDLRKKIAVPITKPIYNKNLNPIDNIFTASNSKKTYLLSTEKQTTDFTEICNKYIAKYIRANRLKIIIDPFGLFLTVIKDGIPQITYVESSEIHDIDYKSIKDIDYIMFNLEPWEEFNLPETFLPLNKGEKIFRVLDGAKDAFYVIRNESIYLVYEQINIFGKVPATINSNKINPSNDAPTSYVEESYVLADEYFESYLDYKIFRKVAIPRVAEKAATCSGCNGSGNDIYTGTTCNKCNGSGNTNKADISNRIIYPRAQVGENDNMSAPVLYLNADVNVFKEMIENLDRLEKKIKQAIWGEGIEERTTQRGDITAYQISIENETEKQLKSNIASNYEIIETFHTDLFGWFYFADAYKGCNIYYGRNFNTFNSGELYERYVKAKEQNLDTTILDEYLERYYYSEYQHDSDTLAKLINELKTKPLFHYSITDIIAMAVNGITEFDYYANIFYSDFVKYFESEKYPISKANLSDIRKELEIYINAKIDMDKMTTTENINSSPVESTNI